MNQTNIFDAEEIGLITSYETSECQSVENVQPEIQSFREYAKATFRKDLRINIRISTKDLHQIQKRGLGQGMPCQTLMTSILRKAISGWLVSKSL